MPINRFAASLATNDDAMNRRQGLEAGRRILVVDDNHDAAEALSEALTLSGHVTQHACDGKDAIEAARTFRPDVALLDIGLPNMDGYELARHLRGIPGLETLKLVAITGYGQASDRERAQASGFHEHLVKPVDLHQLEQVLARLALLAC